MTKIVKHIVRLVVLTAAALLLVFSTAFSNSAKAAGENKDAAYKIEAGANEDATRIFGIVIQSIIVEDGEYQFDSEKAQQLGLTKTEAAAVQKIWDLLSEKLEILSQSFYVKDGELIFDSEKAQELGLSEEEAAAVEQVWDSVSKVITALAVSIYEEDGEYGFDADLAIEAGLSDEETKVLDTFFGSLTQEQLKSIYEALHHSLT